MKNKFSRISAKVTDAVKGADLQETASKKERAIVNRQVYNIPVEWINILKTNNISFSSFAKIAIREKLSNQRLL